MANYEYICINCGNSLETVNELKKEFMVTVKIVPCKECLSNERAKAAVELEENIWNYWEKGDICPNCGNGVGE